MSDLIDRRVAIDALQKEINKAIPPFNDTIGSIRCGVRLARNIIEDLPSAERKPGRWLRIKGEQEYVCQECGQRCLETVMLLPKWDYCPNCGSFNGGAEDG